MPGLVSGLGWCHRVSLGEWRRRAGCTPVVPSVALEAVVPRHQAQVLWLGGAAGHNVVLAVKCLAGPLRRHTVQVAALDIDARLEPASKGRGHIETF